MRTHLSARLIVILTAGMFDFHLAGVTLLETRPEPDVASPFLAIEPAVALTCVDTTTVTWADRQGEGNVRQRCSYPRHAQPRWDGLGSTPRNIT